MGPAAAGAATAAGSAAAGGSELGAAMKFIQQSASDIKLVKSMLKLLAGSWLEVNDAAFKTARTMALGRDQAIQYNKQLLTATKELAAQFGVTAKELADFQKNYAEAVGRNVTLSREQLSHMSALSKIAGESAGKLVDEFDKVGVGVARATAYTGRLQERAKALGVSPAKATKMMADNIRLAASYSFRNGVNDIEKMALKASSMRMDMQSIMKAAEQFDDIEKAIGTSAKIQMLGGSFAAQFSNPMGAMYESWADPAAFQDRILRAIEGKGTYDSKTGTVQFDPLTMRFMKEFAKDLGMSAEELNNTAMAAVQNRKVDEELKAKGKYDEWAKKPEMLDAIRNLSRTNVDEKTGEHFVTVLEGDEEKQVKISELTEEQLKIATDNQLTEEGLWSDVQDIKAILERVHGRARETKTLEEGLAGGAEWWNAMIAGKSDWWMQPFADAVNELTGGMLAERHFAEGGIATPIHAELGTLVPGDSYTGDKVPAMLNSGEMVLNQSQQKSMFSLISGLAVGGGMLYGLNKVGGKVGVGGLGSTMLMANMIGGGDAGVKEYAEVYFLNKFIKKLNPFKKSIEGVGKATEAATTSTTTFGTRWKELTNTLSKDWNSLTKKISASTKKFFTTGRWGKFTSGAKSLASTAASKVSHYGNITASYAKSIGEAIGKYTVKPISKGISKGWEWTKNTKLGLATQEKIGNAQLRYIRAQTGYKNIVKPKLNEYSKLVKNLFNDGSAAQASKAASRLQTPEIAMTGRKTGVANTTKTVSKAVTDEASSITKPTSSIAKEATKAVGNGGKTLSALKGVGKTLGKKIPYIGAALAVGSAVSGMMDASSQYDAKIDEIEKSGMSDRDKARAKDRATKEKNANMGGSVGSAAGGLGGMAAGAAAGAAIGSVVPVIGTAIGGLIGGALGAWGGEALGGTLGKGVGSLFGGSEEEKFLEEQKESAKAIAGNNEEIIKVLKSIDGKMPGSIQAGSNFGLKATELDTTVIRGLTDVGKHVAIKAVDTASNIFNAATGLDRQKFDINVSGTIKLEGNGKSVDLDIDKLIENPEFVRKLTDVINSRTNVSVNGGKKKAENARNQTAKIFN